MSLAPDLKKALKEAFELEEILKPGETIVNLEAAVEAVLETYRRTVVEEIAQQAEAHAHALNEDAGLDYDDNTMGEPAGMLLFAHLLRKHEAPALPYQPEFLDLVTVTISGEVRLQDEGEWSVVDDDTGDEYFFSPDNPPNVRVISRAREDLGA